MVITFEPAGFFFLMQFSMLYSGEQILSFKLYLVFYAEDSLRNQINIAIRFFVVQNYSVIM